MLAATLFVACGLCEAGVESGVLCALDGAEPPAEDAVSANIEPACMRLCRVHEPTRVTGSMLCCIAMERKF